MKPNFTRIILIVIPLVTSSITMCAQVPDWLWAKAIGATGNDQLQSMAIDASGNVYTTGYFNGTVDFDPGAGIFNLTNVGGNCIFISKLDALGNFVWAKALNGGTGFYSSGQSIAVDAFGNIYTTGFFGGAVDFDPGSGIFSLTSAGTYDLFIAKFDNSGNFIWAKAMGEIYYDMGYSIKIDASGNIYTTGFFNGTVDFDPGLSGTFNLTSAGAYDIFILKLDSSGNFVWAKTMGTTTDDLALFSMLDAAGSVYTTGYFSATVDFDPGAGIFNLTSAGSRDIFISKLDSAGNFVWAKAMGGINLDDGYSITIDPTGSGAVYITGDFQGTVDFDPGGGTFNLTSAGNYDIFVLRLDSSGNFIWAKRMGGIDGDVGNSIAIDPAGRGDVYITGFFSETVDFNPGAGVFLLHSSGGTDIFISKLDSSGNFIWAKSMGGITGDYGSSIALDISGNVYLSGYFYSPSTPLGFDTLTNADNSGHSGDLFIAKLGFNSWRSCQALPQFADHAAGFATGGYGYVGTGQDSSGNYLTSMYKFDPSGTGNWSTIANYSIAARARATGFSVNGNGFIGLGYDGSTYVDFLKYNTGSDSWSTTSHALNWNNGGAPSRYYSVTFTIGNKAYVGLGTNGSTVYNDFYSFDGTNWNQIADFPGGLRYAAVAFTIGDTAYVGTGIDGSGATHQDFYAYDPVYGWHTNQINSGAGNERSNAVAFSIGRYGFVALGGHGNGTNCTNDLWQFNPSNNSFTQKPSLPSTSLYNYAVGFSIGGKGYICMGGSCDGMHPTNETWEYIPDYDVTASIIGIKEAGNPYNVMSGIYPNPVTDHASIIVHLNSLNVKLSNINFSISNILGQQVHVENKINKTHEGNIVINMERERLRSGFYIYKIMNGDELLSTGKFVVE